MQIFSPEWNETRCSYMNAKDLLRVKRMLSLEEKLARRIELTGTTRASFIDGTSEQEEMVYDALMVLVLQIVEDATRLSDETTNLLPEHPWKNIRGFRNILAHAYAQVDKELAWDVLARDIPALCRSLEECVRQSS